MRVFVLLFLMVISSASLAEAVSDVIAPLGLSKEDLKSIWHTGRCDPSWSTQVDDKSLQDKNLLGSKGLQAGFFSNESTGDKHTLRAGKKCQVLNDYYFKGDVNPEISEFILLDKKFIGKYGHSVLDAIFIEDTRFYNWSGKVGQFQINYAKVMERKGLFKFEKKRREYNGNTKISIYGERTDSGSDFHDKVFQ